MFSFVGLFLLIALLCGLHTYNSTQKTESVKNQTITLSIATTGLLFSLIMLIFETFVILTRHKHTFTVFDIFRIYVWLIGSGTLLFYIMYVDDPNNFKGIDQDESHDLIPFTYFTTVTVATIGYGDISPNTNWCRVVTIVFILLSMFINVIVIQLVFSKLGYRRPSYKNVVMTE